MTKISEHFTLEELTYSKTAKERGIKNVPNAEQCWHLWQLANQMLEPLRVAWGGPLIVTSGFRGFQLDGSSSTSVHPDGWAADVVPANGEIKRFKKFTVDFYRKFPNPFDQVIDETRDKSEWMHLGLFNKKGEQRRQFLITKDGIHYKFLK